MSHGDSHPAPVAAGKSSFDLIDAREFFARIGLREGDRVADLACGVGRYSVEIAKAVGARGVVYAVDLWDEGLETLRRRTVGEGIGNVRPLRGDITERIPLDDGSVDICLMATVLHDLPPERRGRALSEAARILRPGGTLVLVEFKKVDRGPGPPQRVRISEDEAQAMLATPALSADYVGSLGEFTYLLTARKAAAPG
ncbi:MAG TPA: methyltransferase domain-containing protein [bacterium]